MTKKYSNMGDDLGIKAYYAWTRIKQRCYNPNHMAYKNYGGRGITVCDRWRNSYKNFINDMGYPKVGESIDRINVDGDYTPENCRWTNNTIQQHNKRLLKSNTSGYRGIYFKTSRRKWVALIRKDNIKYIIGSGFVTREEAALAYNRKALELFGSDAVLNVVPTLTATQPRKDQQGILEHKGGE